MGQGRDDCSHDERSLVGSLDELEWQDLAGDQCKPEELPGQRAAYRFVCGRVASAQSDG